MFVRRYRTRFWFALDFDLRLYFDCMHLSSAVSHTDGVSFILNYLIYSLILQDKTEEVKKQKKEENGDDKEADDEEIVEGEEEDEEELGEDEEELDEGEGEAEGNVLIY